MSRWKPKTLAVVWSAFKLAKWRLALGFLLVLVNRASGLVLPASTKFVVDDVIVGRRPELLLPIVLSVFAATLIQGASSFAQTVVLSAEAERLVTGLRVRLQAHLGRLPIPFHDSHRSGALVSRIMTDAEGARHLLSATIVDFLGAVFTASIALVLMLRISQPLTLMALAVFLVYALSMHRAYGRLRGVYREKAGLVGEITARLAESVAAVRVVKGFRAEEREEEVFGQAARKLLDSSLRTLRTTSLLGFMATVFVGGVAAAVMYFGGQEVLSGRMTLGSLITFSIFMGFLAEPTFQIVAVASQIMQALAGLERIGDILETRREDEDPRRVVGLGEPEGRIVFEEVSFGYSTTAEILKDISFSSKPGTMTALVGPSGSGKSTMIGLIIGYYSPEKGRILVDGIDLSTVRLDSYRAHLGVVLQEPFLFDGTIRDNVALARPLATEEEIRKACRVAHVDEFAERFEQGYDTLVGERGIRLSGGQKQRVSIARAILADPRILILDEATSSLDSESEALIQAGLAALMAGRTTFVIAHRLSTTRKADQVFVMEEGRIIERGTHESLYRLEGRYFNLYTRQYGVESNLLPVGAPADEAGS